jgi:hypothetical protein
MTENSIADELAEIQEQRKALDLAEKKLLTTGKPSALADIEKTAIDFKIPVAEIVSYLGTRVDDSIAKPSVTTTMDEKDIKKYQQLLKSYPQYLLKHELVKLEYQINPYRIKQLDGKQLKFEVDAFLSYVYETNNLSVKPENWPTTPLKTNRQVCAAVKKLLKEWVLVGDKRIADEDAYKHFAKLKKVFANEKSIREASDMKLHAALMTLHSYRRVMQFASEFGEPPKIFNPAQSKKLRNSICYLLFNNDPDAVRVSNMCYSPAFDIEGMGTSMILELVGWGTTQPLINDRVVTTLRFLGLDVEPFPEK